MRFYERRIRRILPALFVVSLACIPPAWFWMMPNDFMDFSKSLIAVNFFSSNILFWKENGYFAQSAELKPFLHTWSLAIEEQFYLFFPLLLYTFRKLAQKRLRSLLIILTIVSLLLSEWASKRYPNANFYLLPTRAWELGIGAVIAINSSKWKCNKKMRSQIGSLSGLLMILYSIFFFEKTLPFPGLWGLIPVLGTALIIVCANAQTITGYILSVRPVVGIGLISYSAYLWHQPLFCFARHRIIEGISTFQYLLLYLLALGLAYFSWRFVEKPIRKKKYLSNNKKLLLCCISISLFIIIFGFIGLFEKGFPNRLTERTQQMLNWNDKEIRSTADYSTELGRYFKPNNSKNLETHIAFTPSMAILGDSHAKELTSELAKSLAQKNYGLWCLTSGGCAPVVGYYRSDFKKDCSNYNENIRSFISQHDEIKIILLLCRWAFYLEGNRFDNQEGGIEYGKPLYALPLDKNLFFLSDPSRINEVGLLYRKTVQYFLEKGKRVILVYPVPEVGWNVQAYLAKIIHYNLVKNELLSTSYEVFQKRMDNTYKQLDILADNPNLIRIKPEEIFCNTFIPDRCVAQIDDSPLYYDDNHLSDLGRAMLVQKIMLSLETKNWL